MTLLTTIAAFLITLGILIVVHEYGHYWVARKCGVKVLRFSIGFGRPLKRWVRGEDRTEWVIAAMPLGGYVRMLDERDPECAPIAAGRPAAQLQPPVGVEAHRHRARRPGRPTCCSRSRSTGC